jgi:hypothetical protein
MEFEINLIHYLLKTKTKQKQEIFQRHRREKLQSDVEHFEDIVPVFRYFQLVLKKRK